ncbi:MAG: Fructose-phosphate phosphatase YqaB [Verrucomicrobiota bacterium]
MTNKNNFEPRGLVFDCDGTLADTMPLHWRAWQAISLRHDLHFPEDRFYSLGGVPSRDILKMLAEEQGRPLDHIAVAHEKENAYLPLMSTVEPIHAVVEIARANFGKIPMAVASGGTQAIICQVLEQLLTDLLSRSSLIALMYQSSHSAEHSLEEHIQIVDALEKRDARLAAKLMEKHISAVEKNLRLDPLTVDLSTALRP